MADSLVLISTIALSTVATADYRNQTAKGALRNYCPPSAAGEIPLAGSVNSFTGHNSIAVGSALSSSGWRNTTDGPSETAWFFHRRGARLFEKASYDAAERAFEASLRAQGGTLKENTLLYLAHISLQNGDMGKAKDYALDCASTAGREIDWENGLTPKTE